MKMQKSVVNKNLKTNMWKKKYLKVRDHFYYTGKYRRSAPTICNLRYSIPKAFHNGSNYNYHFIIK